MEHEHANPSPERREQEQEHKPTFNLENFPPDQVAELIDMLGESYPYPVPHGEVPDPARIRRVRMYHALVHDIENFPLQDPAKAYDLYMTMVTSDGVEAQRVAAKGMGQLLQQFPELSEERQRIVDVWMALFERGHENDGYVEAAATAAAGDAIRSGWLDKPTAQRFNRRLLELDDGEGWAGAPVRDESLDT